MGCPAKLLNGPYKSTFFLGPYKSTGNFNQIQPPCRRPNLRALLEASKSQNLALGSEYQIHKPKFGGWETFRRPAPALNFPGWVLGRPWQVLGRPAWLWRYRQFFLVCFSILWCWVFSPVVGFGRPGPFYKACFKAKMTKSQLPEPSNQYRMASVLPPLYRLSRFLKHDLDPMVKQSN